MERFCITMSESDVDKFEAGRNAVGMNKSAYVRLLIAEHEGSVPGFIKYKEIIEKLSEIELDLKTLVLKDSLTAEEKLKVYTRINEVEKCVKNKFKG